MDAKLIKRYLSDFTKHFPATLPAMGWYFSSIVPPDAVTFKADSWTCMFKHINEVISGKKLCFSREASGCSGAACYLGFKQPHETAGRFLAEGEKFKEKAEYGNEFYKQIKAEKTKKKYLVLSKIETIADDKVIEVVNYWVSPLSLSGLVTLSNFDSPANDKVSIPFASGCQSMWTIPYKEKNKETVKATIGALDPAMRHYIPNDTLLFSVPTNRFVTLCENTTNSFASEKSWLELIHTGI